MHTPIEMAKLKLEDLLPVKGSVYYTSTGRYVMVLQLGVTVTRTKPPALTVHFVQLHPDGGPLGPIQTCSLREWTRLEDAHPLRPAFRLCVEQPRPEVEPVLRVTDDGEADLS